MSKFDDNARNRWWARRDRPKKEKKPDMAYISADFNNSVVAPGSIVQVSYTLDPVTGMVIRSFGKPPSASTKPAFDPKMETIVEPIVGWRKWKAGLWDDTIASINGQVWPVREPLKAKCNVSSDSLSFVVFGGSRTCQGIRCSCGVYAFRTEPQVLAEFPNGPSPRDPAGVAPEPEMFNIVGEVSLWGRIIECDKGYRAQYAYPKSFRNNGPIAAKLAEVYGVKLI